MGGDASVLPSGDVTFLLTDIEGSTALLARLGPERFRTVLELHRQAIGAVVEQHGGVLFKSDGDGLLIAFGDAAAAVRAAPAAQRALAGLAWPDGERPAVRMALHSGEALADRGDYVSIALHRASRLVSAPHGGQVICSSDVLARLVPAAVDPPPELLGAYWMRDFPDIVRIYQLDDGGGRRFPPLAAPRADLTNMHGHAPELIGRDGDLSRLLETLTSARLVTVTGAGGVGKTALATAAAELLVRRGEAAWLVELAPVEHLPGEDAVAVEQRLFAAIGRSLGMAVESRGAVLARLTTRSVVLVVDNCEHVIDAAAAVIAEILQNCPTVCVLATSREPLGLPQESIVAVAPLDLPPDDAVLAEVAGAPAVRLLVERARQANPAFVVGAHNADAVAQLCREVDGLPLALELAASSTRYLTPRDMLARLREVGSLPLQASRRPVARHRNLAALLDWSLAALTPEQLALFRRLGAFAGPVTADAVSAVCGSGASKWAVSDALHALVEKNLVVLRDDGVQGRYDLLVTLRRAARQLLDEAAEHDAALAAHARWVVSRVRRLEAATARERHAAEAELVPEVMLVLDRAERIGLSVEDRVMLAGNYTVRIAIRSPERAKQLTEQLLARDDLTPAERSHVYTVRLRTYGVETDVALVDEAVALARSARQPRDLLIALVARLLGTTGVVDVRSTADDVVDDLADVRAEIADLVDQLGRPNLLTGVAENTFGVLAARAGDYAAARAHYEAFLRAAEADGDGFNIGVALYNLGETDELAGDEAAAIEGYARAAVLFRRDDYHLQHAASAMAVAALYEKWGDLDAATDWAADALLAARRTGSTRLLLDAMLASARIALAAKDLGLADASAREVLLLAPDGPAAEQARDVLARMSTATRC